jgi:hypothetical protein
MNRRQALVLRAFALWTVFVWVTFVRNIWHDHARSFGFKAVHTGIALVSVAFAVVAWLVIRQVRRGDGG